MNRNCFSSENNLLLLLLLSRSAAAALRALEITASSTLLLVPPSSSNDVNRNSDSEEKPFTKVSNAVFDRVLFSRVNRGIEGCMREISLLQHHDAVTGTARKKEKSESYSSPNDETPSV